MAWPGSERYQRVVCFWTAAAVLFWPGARPGEGAGSHRVRLRGPAAGALLESAERAGERLAAPECRRVLSDFADASGTPLETRLERLGLSPEAYLTAVVFADGTGLAVCDRRGVLAATEPGSRVVYVCPRFLQSRIRDPGHAEAVLIHEMLHTLGLGENPPLPEVITARVRARCG
jgi:hypothetical protein